jgi:hypothetical protein
MMATYTMGPDEQIRRRQDYLAELQSKLLEAGIPVGTLANWMDVRLSLREMYDQHARGELRAVEYDPDND